MHMQSDTTTGGQQRRTTGEEGYNKTTVGPQDHRTTGGPHRQEGYRRTPGQDPHSRTNPPRPRDHRRAIRTGWRRSVLPTKPQQGLGAMLPPFHLRSLTATLTATPEPSLPSDIPAIASALYSTPILEAAFHTASTKNEDTSVLLHKYKTRVSSLLQSRSTQGKWAGVALVKASMESSPEALGAWAKSWVPLVQAILGRPEPTATITLSLTTLSTIFNALTPSKPTLTRELTTPNLKPFLEATLHLLSPPLSSNYTSGSQLQPTLQIITDSPTLLPSALRAIAQTLPAHATTFRPFVKRTQSILLAILSSPPYALTEEVESLSLEILINLHLCAIPSSRGTESSGGERNTTANAISAEWTRLLHCTISDLHTTLTTLFSPILEDPSLTPESSNNTLCLPPPSDGPSIQADRALLLLRLLSTFFTLPTTVPVTTPLSTILTLTSRILTLTPPHAHPNPTHSASSRDRLFTLLPQLHLTTISLIDILVRRLGELFIPAALQTITIILSIWDYANLNSDLRVAVYGVLNNLLTLVGGGMPKGAGWKKVVKIAECAVEDVLRPYMAVKEHNTILANLSASTSGKRKKGGAGISTSLKSSTATAALADTLLNTATSSMADSQSQQLHTCPPTEKKIAIAFLETLLTRLPAQRIPSELRTKIDRMAILTNTRELLLASVLFPAGYVRGSLLPFLVAGKAMGGMEELAVQGVCWPRMPVVRVGEDVEEEEGGEEEEDEEVEEGAMDIDRDVVHNVYGRVDIIDENAEPLSREEKWSRALRTATSTKQSQVVPPPSPPLPQSQRLFRTPPPPPPPPATPAKPPPPSSYNDSQDSIHVLPTLTPSERQLHRDMLRAAVAAPETPHPTKRVKLSPPAAAPAVSETTVVGGSIGDDAGGARLLGDSDEDDEGEMVIPEIDFGGDSDNDDDDSGGEVEG
ncbi:rRNA processing/ribosome biogenesis-domain-containing protein [Terfezia claveryi]|nr:rRNA processing/ribosome biogenesis-domain-containing protein [Terfezia claveryi]